MGRFSRIDLKTSGHREEVGLTAIVRPGQLVTMAGALAAADFTGPFKVVLEDPLQDHGVDDSYASGDIGFVMEPKSGDVFAGWAEDAAYTLGQNLIWNGTLFVDAGASTDPPAFVSMEAVTLAADALLKIKRI
jgi:hypothetical protein